MKIRSLSWVVWKTTRTIWSKPRTSMHWNVYTLKLGLIKNVNTTSINMNGRCCLLFFVLYLKISWYKNDLLNLDQRISIFKFYQFLYKIYRALLNLVENKDSFWCPLLISWLSPFLHFHKYFITDFSNHWCFQFLLSSDEPKDQSCWKT